MRIVFAVVLLPAVALALAWHALGLPLLLLVLVGGGWLLRRRRRAGRRRRAARAALATAAIALVCWLGAGAARAQADFQPYWAGDDAAAAPAGEARPDWVLGIKLGPYVPGIDAQLGTTDGPYKQMFGGYNIMPVLEVDRIVLRGVGQLTIGGSAGYLGKTGYAWKQDTSGMTIPGDVATGDKTSFRLVPLAATASYRLTYLDDRYGVPLVPYVRGGLSYYLWWVRAPNGSIAAAPKDGCADTAKCGNKALGASAGLQGSIGLELRAERVDPDAMASMRGSGIEHAGFYAEYQVAWVDGFGKATKLAVGDNTWFAGFDFEF